MPSTQYGILINILAKISEIEQLVKFNENHVMKVGCKKYFIPESEYLHRRDKLEKQLAEYWTNLPFIRVDKNTFKCEMDENTWNLLSHNIKLLNKYSGIYLTLE